MIVACDKVTKTRYLFLVEQELCFNLANLKIVKLYKVHVFKLTLRNNASHLENYCCVNQDYLISSKTAVPALYLYGQTIIFFTEQDQYLEVGFCFYLVV